MASEIGSREIEIEQMVSDRSGGGFEAFEG